MNLLIFCYLIVPVFHKRLIAKPDSGRKFEEDSKTKGFSQGFASNVPEEPGTESSTYKLPAYLRIIQEV
jgi:hypothetical protein